MADDQDKVTRGRGRPRVDEPLERVSTRIPVSDYDRWVLIANRRGESLSEVMRKRLKLRPLC